MSATLTLWVALAGAAGALARYVVDGGVRARVTARVPVSTLTINVSGSLFLGVLTGLVLFHGQSSTVKTVAGTGFCGGYTTFSTASVETARLLRDRAWWPAVLSGLGTLVLTVAAGGAGLALAAAA